ncbi:MAG: hypothetical protein O2820_09495 [Planctomycetota bacterium]|nr:hypothetical protein [Planctomycetota bacterium]MDA1249447.1 hypothetical protein [Planctomycetota bacterium]
MSESEEVSKAESTLKPRSRFGFLLRLWCLILVTVLTILVAALLGYRSSRLAGIPPIDEVVDRETEGRFPIEPDENAFTIYGGILKELDSSTSRVISPDLGDACDALESGGWVAAAPLAQVRLDECEAMLIEWKRGTDRTRGVRVQPADMEPFDFPHIYSCREIARLALLKSARCLHDGQPKESWLWLRALLRFSRHLGNPGMEIDRLVGTSTHAMASVQLIVWAAHPDVTANHLAVALNELREIYGMTSANSLIWKTEYLHEMKILSNPEWVEAISDYSGPVLDGYLFLNAEPDLCRVLLRHVYANQLTQIDLPRYERTMTANQQLFLTTRKETPPLMDASPLEETLNRSQLAQYSLPNLRFFLDATDRERARQTAMELGLCVELFRRKHGKYPETLQELVPQFLAEVPRDLFGVGPAERMLMTRRDIEEPAEEGDKNVTPQTRPWLIIYSRGRNAIDNGGHVESIEDVGIRIPLPQPEARPSSHGRPSSKP